MEIKSLKAVYFSPTGTTKKIIETIVEGIDCGIKEIVDITRPDGRMQPLRIAEDELLILGVPVYFGRVQTDAIEWLNTIAANKTPAVCVVVYGNRDFDDALLELKETVTRKGCMPIACAAFIGEHSFSNSEAPIAASRPDADDLASAKSFGEQIGQKLLSVQSTGDFAGISVPGDYPYVDMAESRKRLSALDFIAVDNSCTQCGDCATHCPVGAIDSKDFSTVNTAKCILCHACIKMCPANARRINNEMMKNIALGLSQRCQGRKEPTYFL